MQIINKKDKINIIFRQFNPKLSCNFEDKSSSQVFQNPPCNLDIWDLPSLH